MFEAVVKNILGRAVCLLCAAVPAAAADGMIPCDDPAPGAWFLRSVARSRAQHEAYYRGRLDKLGTPEERARKAEAFHRMLEERFIANRAEDAAIEKGLNWPAGDFTWHSNCFYAKLGCTSWMVTPEYSSTGASMLQKTRDYSSQKLLSARLFRSAPGRWKILSVGDLWSTGSLMVMNEKGLMITQNDGPGIRKFAARAVTAGSPFVLRYLAEHCADVPEALAVLKQFYALGLMRGGDIYFLADPRRGAVAEASGDRISAAEIPFGFEVRANHYLLPGMQSAVDIPRGGLHKIADRRYRANEYLRGIVRRNGRIAPADLVRLSRLRDPEQEKNGIRQICMQHTITSTLMIPDPQFPEVLSVALVGLGPTRHTVFLPIAMGLSALPEALADGSWGSRSFALREKWGLDHDRLAQFEALEGKFLGEFFTAREEARKLLLNDKRPEAIALLDRVFLRQYREADAFLNGLAVGPGSYPKNALPHPGDPRNQPRK